MVMTLIGAFDQKTDAAQAVDELERAGFPRGSVSLSGAGAELPESAVAWYAEQAKLGRALLVARTDDVALATQARELMNAGAIEVWEDPLAASSRPEVPQLTNSGARLYDVSGLEFDPVKSRFEDFRKS